jgi:hypothetical protein
MDKEIIVDQEEITINIVDDELTTEKVDYSDISDEDITVVDESEIDWSTL